MKYLPQWLREDWQRDANNMVARDSTPAGRQALMDFYLQGLEITGEAHRAGVRILVGTDGGDSFAFPGSGMHDEMGELATAGLANADVLRAATLDAAEFLGISDRYGSVESEKRADLVLLDANPLDEIANIGTIRAVIFGGAVLNRERLDDLLQLAETTATRPL
jgi:imidazolonepropionase-like amidohydrolase